MQTGYERGVEIKIERSSPLVEEKFVTKLARRSDENHDFQGFQKYVGEYFLIKLVLVSRSYLCLAAGIKN